MSVVMARQTAVIGSESEVWRVRLCLPNISLIDTNSINPHRLLRLGTRDSESPENIRCWSNIVLFGSLGSPQTYDKVS